MPMQLLRDKTVSANPAGFGGPAPIVVQPDPSQDTTVLQVVPTDDGGVELRVPAAKKPANDDQQDDSFDENLAEKMDDGALATIAEEILQGVEADIMSRQKFVENLAKGLDLLGLEIKEVQQSKGGGSVSQVQHPVMLEAVVKAQSQAGAELMPSGGPCKVSVRGKDTQITDEMANALERDMNWYLTTGAPEYYPDFDRGLFGLFFSGNLFKKIYHHPIRRRPVSESIATDDLIVSQDATDLETATRVTHRAFFSNARVRRMVKAGAWRDVGLSTPYPVLDPVKLKEGQITGQRQTAMRPQDLEHTIYETTTDLDLELYGIDVPGSDGIWVPVRVTIDKDSRQVLAIHRAWKKGDPDFKRRQRFVHYGMIPAFDFLCLGYLHLLGNQAKALTAIWRLLVDAGMFANFPGGMRAKGTRTGTNEINPGPGEFAEVDIGSYDDIRKAVMAMPYKDPSAVFIQLAEIIGQDAQRLGGAIEFDVGEGKTNVPVGTMLAMVEQATQTTAAVHKRLHAAQAREMMLLKECFAEDPESLWRLNPDPAHQWQTAEEFESLDLVPSSDPNVPAQIHRIMLALALVTMAQQNPAIYDAFAAHKRAWGMLGVDDTDEFLHQAAPQQGQPDPMQGILAKSQTDLEIAKLRLQGQQEDTQRKAAEAAVDAQEHQQEVAADTQARAAEQASDERIANTREETERVRLAAEQDRAHLDRQVDLHKHAADLADRAAGRTMAPPGGLAPQGF